MNIQQIEENIKNICENTNEEKFIFDFLLSFGIPKATIARLAKGDYNSSKESDEVLWKKKIFFKVDKENNLLTVIDDLKRADRVLKHKPMFIVVTDFKSLLALDLKVGDTLDIKFNKLPRHFEFFLPLIGLEKTKIQMENPADIKAAEKFGKLYDVLVESNHPKTDQQKHGLNVLLSRLLFCFFAEDTNIFPDGLFTNSLASHTKEDGSDLAEYLDKLFKVLNDQKRKNTPGYLSDFPYVNGGLFKEVLLIPKFNSKSRNIILDCGSLNWANINPDIFGSMIQAVANPEIRDDIGMHYTSVVNIMKVIEPLFLNELKDELEKSRKSKKQLRLLLDRLYSMRIFDPACGSGNFLVIAYKELCALEIAIYLAMNAGQMEMRLESGLKTSQFYGIEIDEFAHETAKLALYIAEHQMNMEFEEIFGVQRATLPLREGGNIVCGNALRIDWESICPKQKDTEIFIVGNPPYCGTKNQNVKQKEDMKSVMQGFSDTKSLDYVCCWIIKAANFIDTNIKASLVTTNSIYQGTQVPLLWPKLLDQNIEIFFAHKDFLWKNNAKKSAGVTCSIVGLRQNSNEPKYLFENKSIKKVSFINPYLVEGPMVWVSKRSKPLSGFPIMQTGNQPYDEGNLTFSDQEKLEFVQKYPELKKFFKKLIGSNELLNGTFRWCLWLEDEDLELVNDNSEIQERIRKIYEYRSQGGEAARSCKDRPHQFRWVNRPKEIQLVIPWVSSQRRKYIPMAFLDREYIITNAAQVIFDPSPYIFGVLNSTMHMAWMKLFTGRMKTDFRYTTGLVYNCLPFPIVNEITKEEIESHSFKILEVREKYSELTLSELYDPLKMPPDLFEAHKNLDLIIDKCYRNKPFLSDEERLGYLFKLYVEMIEEEKKIELMCSDKKTAKVKITRKNKKCLI